MNTVPTPPLPLKAMVEIPNHQQVKRNSAYWWINCCNLLCDRTCSDEHFTSLLGAKTVFIVCPPPNMDACSGRDGAGQMGTQRTAVNISHCSCMVTPVFQLLCWSQRGFDNQPVSIRPWLDAPGPWGGHPGWGPWEVSAMGLVLGSAQGSGFLSHCCLCVCVCSIAGLWAGRSEWTDGQFGGANEATQCYHRLSLLTALDEVIIIPEHCNIPGFLSHCPLTQPHHKSSCCRYHSFSARKMPANS